MAVSRLLKALPAALLLALAGTGLARADMSATATYVVNLGGNIIATAKFKLTATDTDYDLVLNANVTGVAQLVASGTAKVRSSGAVTPTGLRSNSFDLATYTGDDKFSDKVTFANGDVTGFLIDPPIVNNIDRIPIERSQLVNVNDTLAAFIQRANALDSTVCNHKAGIFTGVERFDLTFTYVKAEQATSPRTGYQGPVVLCKLKYVPISGHYTTSELTNSLAQDDRILIWYMPLRDTGFYMPYRVLMSTSSGDLSMVLTDLGD